MDDDNEGKNMRDLLTVVILTYNEEKNIAECIDSCSDIADRIIVMDNNSSDNTTIIAEKKGATVIKSELLVRDRIRWILEGDRIKTKWILFLDADERMTPESSIEFRKLCEDYQNDNNVNGIVVRYRPEFIGKILYHGGFSPLKKLRGFKVNTAYYEIAEVDEHFVLKKGSMVYMKNDFIHMDYKGIRTWVDKHTVYAQRAAMDYINKTRGDEVVNYKGLETGARIKRFIKYNIYYKLPMGFRAKLFYCYCYYFRLGFLDGKEGRMYAFLHSYWYRYLIDVFVYANEAGNQEETCSRNNMSDRERLKSFF